MVEKQVENSSLLELLEYTNQLGKIGVFKFDALTEDIYWNDIMREIYEVDDNFTPTIQNVFCFTGAGATNDKLERGHLDTLKHDTPQKIEHEITTARGNKRIVQCTTQPTFSNGKLTNILGTVFDITERKLSERELLQRNKQLNFAEEIAQMGYWEWKPMNDKFIWSDNLYKIFGLEVGIEMSLELLVSRVHPDDKEHVQQVTMDLFETKKFKKFTYRIIPPKGAIKTLEVLGQVECDDSGNIVKLIGVTQDITHRIATEHELTQKNQNLLLAENIAKIGFWQWTPEKDEFIWSENLYRIFEYEIGTKMSMELFSARFHPEDLEKINQNVNKFMEKGVFEKYSYRILLPNGTIKVLEVLGQYITPNEKNKQQILSGVIQDITDRVDREQELRNKNKLLSMASQIAKMGYWTWKIEEDKHIWSDNLYTILELDPNTKLNSEIVLSLVHPDDKKTCEDAMKLGIATKKFPKFRHRRICKNGAIKTLELSAEVIINENGDIVEFIGTTLDITDIIKNEIELLKANNNLKESKIKLTARNKQLAEFNHITSHNLRSPVSNLNALLSMFKDPTYEDLKEELFQKFEIVIDHLTLTLDTLVESLKVKHEANKSIQKLSFDETLNKTKEILAAEIIQTNAIIKCNFTNVPKIVYNQIYLESIFLNLIGNAIKYKSKDRVPEIEIESKEANGKVHLSFKDNGIGIDLKQHGDKLFGLNKVFHRHPDAKGIGLFLTKAQVEAMGGTISAQSEVNVGSTFTVTLN
ncbi:PAS domain-containing sensor histidine kinase [Maribacter sp. MAR_2009_72]|uniref:sensor histidine kinase n=1 Tax=Maribacter sp. MAR_2009_72 TaxID=1250050 RepID=UPI00119A28E5|nr:PAS domain-containing sensor histidine kinase [Maribacter sp. MAR_2009_72]TVZ16800.1 PAS domain S-box-containing protein [Maribacter sp. MAR_2009_72]